MITPADWPVNNGRYWANGGASILSDNWVRWPGTSGRVGGRLGENALPAPIPVVITVEWRGAPITGGTIQMWSTTYADRRATSGASNRVLISTTTLPGSAGHLVTARSIHHVRGSAEWYRIFYDVRASGSIETRVGLWYNPWEVVQGGTSVPVWFRGPKGVDYTVLDPTPWY